MELGNSKTGADDKIHSGDAGLESMSGPGEGLVGTLLCEGATVPAKSGTNIWGTFCVATKVCVSCITYHSLLFWFSETQGKTETYFSLFTPN